MPEVTEDSRTSVVTRPVTREKTPVTPATGPGPRFRFPGVYQGGTGLRVSREVTWEEDEVDPGRPSFRRLGRTGSGQGGLGGGTRVGRPPTGSPSGRDGVSRGRPERGRNGPGSVEVPSTLTPSLHGVCKVLELE